MIIIKQNFQYSRCKFKPLLGKGFDITIPENNSLDSSVDKNGQLFLKGFKVKKEDYKQKL